MRLNSPSLHSLAAAATEVTMSSSRVSSRGRNQWRRRFSDGSDGGRGRSDFVSGDSHFRTVRDANYGFRQGNRGNYQVSGGFPQQSYRPRLRPYRPQAPRPADYRNWEYATSLPPSHCERFVVLSYNILADYLAREHRPRLYFHIPHHVLDWEWRKRRILLEFGLWSPDVMCLQEVDRFNDIEEELKLRGYSGIWKMRTGMPVDGCAIFWRMNRFILLHEENIEFNKLGLRDNVAQICVLESRSQSSAGSGSAASPTSHRLRGANQIVICNIHVLYNPNRGEIKLGQVRVLLDRAHAVSRDWNDAPVIVCGDFNCIPKSPLYNFICEQKLNLSGLAKNQVSGQFSARRYAPPPNDANPGHGLYRAQCPSDNLCGPSTSVDEKHQEGILHGCDTYGSGVIDPLKETVNSFDKQGELAVNLRNDVAQGLTPPIASYREDIYSVMVALEHGEKTGCSESVHSFEKTLNGQYSMSNVDVPNEQASLELELSSVKFDLSQGPLDSSAEVKNGYNASNLYTSNPVVATVQENILHGSMEKENLNFDRKTLFVEGSVCYTETQHEIKIVNPIISDISASDIVSESTSEIKSDSFSKQMDTYSSEFITIEEKGNSTISYESAGKSRLVDASTSIDPVWNEKMLDFSHDKVSDISKEDTPLGGNYTTSHPSEEKLIYSSEAVSMSDIILDNRFIRPDSEEVEQSTEECASTSDIQRDQLKDSYSGVVDGTTESYCFGVDQSADISNVFCSSRETYDLTYAKERTGKGKIGECREELASDMSSSDQTQSLSCPDVNEFHSSSSSEDHIIGKKGEVNFEKDHAASMHESQLDSLSTGGGDDFSISVDPKTADLDKYVYDPYLWSSMEIEAASGNAEFTLLEHHLKLKSAYAEVQDYSGTKDASREPQVTSYNRQFMGTVDYIWCSEGLQTVKVLDTLPKHVLQWTPGFPTRKWGSDHLALACELAFVEDLSTTDT